MPTGKQLRQLVEQRCAELGISLSEVSRLAGRNQSWLHNVFSSEKVQTTTIHTLAKALEVPAKYFFAQSNNENSDIAGDQE